MPKKKEIEVPTLENLEDHIKDAILEDDYSDTVFASLFDLIYNAKTTNRNIFESPLDEPLFFRRHVLKWVEEGIAEKAKMSNFFKK